MSKLSNYESKQPTSQLLKEGDHVVTLVHAIECTSFDDIKGRAIAGQKAKLPEWYNPMDQLAILVASGNGSMMHRLQLGGCVKFNELSDRDLQSGQFVDVKGYACKKTKKGLERMEDPERTEKSMRILDHFLWALGQPEGTIAMECIEIAIAEKIQFGIEVVSEPWTDEETGNITEQYRISKFTRLSEIKAEATSEITA